jgi:hypothetical protein
MPIEKRDGKWYIHNVKGASPSYAAALKRLRAIQANKRKGKKHGSRT